MQSQDSLSATSSPISIAGRVNWQVRGTAANPVITGRTTLSSGELFYRNVRYELQKGVITFDNPNETHPVMNVSVTTTVEQYNLTLTLRGPLDKLTTSYVSDPPLAAADIINLVARGKTTQESAGSSQSTDSMIASQAASQLSSSVQKLAGLSSLQIDPTVGGNNQNPSARIALQQRITRDFLFTFQPMCRSRAARSCREYQLNKRWFVSMARDQSGASLWMAATILLTNSHERDYAAGQVEPFADRGACLGLTRPFLSLASSHNSAPTNRTKEVNTTRSSRQ